ncbi:hypothetical protein HDU85_005875 [Gaertneriomyces sp. JEL0708]|nr:hypothetical protein HDU85_005875 [Gaertneriomyces sp. JEL0708]
MGDPQLLKCFASRFRNLKRLHIGGTPWYPVIVGYTSAMVRYLADTLTPNCLTHLSVQGYGYESSFSWKAYTDLISRHPSLRKLVIGYIDKDYVNLGDLGRYTPHLESLCWALSSFERAPHRFISGPSLDRYSDIEVETLSALKCLSITVLTGLEGAQSEDTHRLVLAFMIGSKPLGPRLQEMSLPKMGSRFYRAWDIHSGYSLKDLKYLQIHTNHAGHKEILADIFTFHRCRPLKQVVLHAATRPMYRKILADVEQCQQPNGAPSRQLYYHYSCPGWTERFASLGVSVDLGRPNGYVKPPVMIQILKDHLE